MWKPAGRDSPRLSHSFKTGTTDRTIDRPVELFYCRRGTHTSALPLTTHTRSRHERRQRTQEAIPPTRHGRRRHGRSPGHGRLLRWLSLLLVLLVERAGWRPRPRTDQGSGRDRYRHLLRQGPLRLHRRRRQASRIRRRLRRPHRRRPGRHRQVRPRRRRRPHRGSRLQQGRYHPRELHRHARARRKGRLRQPLLQGLPRCRLPFLG